jgi:conjugal transfer mating pair stabilization protein TraN
MVRILILLCLNTFACFSVDHKNEGKAFGKNGVSFALDISKQLDGKDLLPDEVKNKKFDSQNAKAGESLEFLTSSEVQRNQQARHFDEDELFFKNSEKVFIKEEAQPMAEEIGYSLHTCYKSGNPFVVTVERTLNVNVTHEGINNHVCLGHQEIIPLKRKENIEKSVEKQRARFASDPTILSYDVQVLITPLKNAALMVSWRHVNNASNCSNYELESTDEWKESGDVWIYDNPDLFTATKGIEYTLIEQACVDASPSKIINGKEVRRQCWKERLSYLYQIPEDGDCDFLKQKNCEQIGQQCKQDSPFGCIQWELTFKCFDSIFRKYTTSMLQDEEVTVEYTPNQSFSEVAAKLAVFDEAKKDMEKSGHIDVTKLEIFKGKKMQCSKSVADNLMYDCCFRYAGLAKQMKLAKCTADEIGLAEMQENGLCYYVGSYEEKVLDLWKSRDEHVFCCFSSKLARLVQEEGRDQLHLGWGTAEEPNCRGFTTDQLAKLNFAKMDLSEMASDFKKQLPEDMPDRLQDFHNRLQQDIDSAEFKK